MCGLLVVVNRKKERYGDSRGVKVDLYAGRSEKKRDVRKMLMCGVVLVVNKKKERCRS